MSIEIINPATNKIVRTYEEMSKEEAFEVIEKTQKAFLSWRDQGFSTKKDLMKKAAAVLRDKKEDYAALMVEEMGKPIGQARVEIEKCAFVCEFYSEKAEEFLQSEVIKTDAQKSFVSFQPLGIVFAIMPWNFPFWQVFRFLAPVLMAGNAGILKHSPNTTGCALAIEEVVKEAGFPEDIFRSLVIDVSLAKDIIEHPDVKAVTLTGSTRAGKAVAAQAGAVLKKAVLELGGSDPYIVLESADLGKAVKSCVTSRMINSGQSCVAAKRFIVVDTIKEAFESKFVELMESKKLGDPTDEKTEVGPLARFDLRDELHRQVQQSVKDGAKLLCGGEIPKMEGAYYPPTVLTDVKEGILAYSEELFGPVATIIGAKDEEDAIRIANDNIYGLGSAVFTGDTKRGEQIAEKRIDAGACFINGFVRSDPRLPFGGIKESGYGRELSSFGIREFVNIKTVCIA